MKILALITALLLPAGARATDPWSRTDMALQLAFTGITVIDCLQTHTIAQDPRWEETNRFLGRHPSHAKVNAYCGAALVATAAAAILLRQPYRRMWQVILIGIESEAVYHNHEIGVGLSFRW